VVWEENVSIPIWTDDDNWVGGNAPSAGDDVEFGNSSMTNIIGSPALTFGGVTFTSEAIASYIIDGDGTFSGNATLEENNETGGSHTITMSYVTNGATFDIQSVGTPLILGSVDYGGESSNLIKTGIGTLTITDRAFDAGSFTINEGTIDMQADVGETLTEGDSNFRLITTNASAVFTNSASTGSVATFGSSPSADATASFAGSMTGNLSLELGDATQDGTHTLTQTFTSTTVNTYTGGTAINYGTLIMNGTHVGGDSYQIENTNSEANNGGTLAGSGTIVLAEASDGFAFYGVNSSTIATLKPGESDTDTATLTLGSESITTTVDLDQFSAFEVDLGSSGQTDHLMLFGDLELSGFFNSLVLNSQTGAFDGSDYTIVTYSGNLSGTFATTTGLDSSYFIDYGSGTNDTITLRLIPEPSSTGLLVVAGISLLILRRPQRNRHDDGESAVANG